MEKQKKKKPLVKKTMRKGRNEIQQKKPEGVTRMTKALKTQWGNRGGRSSASGVGTQEKKDA